ncbi:hypothetical protein DFH09DRAFT_1351752 [Mycena vulgaris]|nr:hypothetical protein DFH09DRAFT_1351752 [Mycena vulgaris]
MHQHVLRCSKSSQTCLDSIQLAQQGPGWSVEKRVDAQTVCMQLESGDTHGTVVVDVRKKASVFGRLYRRELTIFLRYFQCYSTEPMGCLPKSFAWPEIFFRQSDIKDALGIPDHVNFSIVSDEVTQEFQKYGDIIQPAYLLYEPLLAAGIRLLHYVGAQDANCAWPGVISFDEFLRAADVPWPTRRMQPCASSGMAQEV